MRNVVKWGMVAVAAGLLAPAAWACGASKSASANGPIAQPASTAAAQQTPANFTPSPRWSSLAYSGSDQAPASSLATPGMGTTGSHPEALPVK